MHLTMSRPHSINSLRCTLLGVRSKDTRLPVSRRCGVLALLAAIATLMIVSNCAQSLQTVHDRNFPLPGGNARPPPASAPAAANERQLLFTGLGLWSFLRVSDAVLRVLPVPALANAAVQPGLAGQPSSSICAASQLGDDLNYSYKYTARIVNATAASKIAVASGTPPPIVVR